MWNTARTITFNSVETDHRQNSFRHMKSNAASELERAARELVETKRLADQQNGIVARLKRVGADTKQAICLLVDLLELQEMREHRLARLRIQRRRSTNARNVG
jgi:hypothetical protein